MSYGDLFKIKNLENMSDEDIYTFVLSFLEMKEEGRIATDIYTELKGNDIFAHYTRHLINQTMLKSKSSSYFNHNKVRCLENPDIFRLQKVAIQLVKETHLFTNRYMLEKYYDIAKKVHQEGKNFQDFPASTFMIQFAITLRLRMIHELKGYKYLNNSVLYSSKEVRNFTCNLVKKLKKNEMFPNDSPEQLHMSLLFSELALLKPKLIFIPTKETPPNIEYLNAAITRTKSLSTELLIKEFIYSGMLLFKLGAQDLEFIQNPNLLYSKLSQEDNIRVFTGIIFLQNILLNNQKEKLLKILEPHPYYLIFRELINGVKVQRIEQVPAYRPRYITYKNTNERTGFFEEFATLLGGGLSALASIPFVFLEELTDSDMFRNSAESIARGGEILSNRLGKIIDGGLETIYGGLSSDEYKLNRGIGKVGNAVGSTLSDGLNAIYTTFKSGEDVIEGFLTGNNEQLNTGASTIVQKALVTSLIGFEYSIVSDIDFPNPTYEQIQYSYSLEYDRDYLSTYTELTNPDITRVPQLGFELENQYNNYFDKVISEAENPTRFIEIETINDNLEGGLHPETLVEFERENITLPTKEGISGVFPEFESLYTVQLPEDMFFESDHTHFSYANEQLSKELESNTLLLREFSQSQINEISVDKTPTGYTWDHDEEVGRLELVDKEIHANTAHTGGRSLWGGGTNNR
jgi:hypothetical protein